MSQRWMNVKRTMLGMVASRAAAARAEPDDALDADVLREPQRQRRQVGALEDDEREEELVPGGDEREQGRDDDPGSSSGAMIPVRIWNRVAPSTVAASSRSGGIPRT